MRHEDTMGWSKAAPPPPEPTVIDIVLAKAAEFPNVTTAILVVVNFYLLLNLLAAMMVKRPGVPIKARASDKVVYKKNEAVTVTDPKGEGIVRVAATGIASLKPTTLCKLFAAAAKTFPQKPALKETLQRPPMTSVVTVGGRLLGLTVWNQWKEVTQARWVRKLLHNGLRLDFHSTKPPSRPALLLLPGP